MIYLCFIVEKANLLTKVTTYKKNSAFYITDTATSYKTTTSRTNYNYMIKYNS